MQHHPQHPLLGLAQARRSGRAAAIASICSAHPLVIEAAMAQALADGAPVLIEATSNQVDQFGGYTGMRPQDFRAFVLDIAARVGIPEARVLLGGDHLGPNRWRARSAGQALELARELLRSYAAAGFVKLHLDASMRCADDPPRLADAVVAARAALLCQAAEQAAGADKPVYVIGTEVPTPGGATEPLGPVAVSTRADAERSLRAHREAFLRAGLADAWQRVIALVVQPGVEFDHSQVLDYAPAAASGLTALLAEYPQFVFEAHSTDYQRPEALAQLVRDGFAILKVGPAATFALREALYALSAIEALLLPPGRRANLPAVVDAAMLANPGHWSDYYRGDSDRQRLLRVFSYSDRMRYYWADPAVQAAVRQLFDGLAETPIAENLLSQFLPQQYQAVRAGRLAASPRALVLDRIRQAIRPYSAACAPGTAGQAIVPAAQTGFVTTTGDTA